MRKHFLDCVEHFCHKTTLFHLACSTFWTVEMRLLIWAQSINNCCHSGRAHTETMQVPVGSGLIVALIECIVFFHVTVLWHTTVSLLHSFLNIADVYSPLCSFLLFFLSGELWLPPFFVSPCTCVYCGQPRPVGEALCSETALRYEHPWLLAPHVPLSAAGSGWRSCYSGLCWSYWFLGWNRFCVRRSTQTHGLSTYLEVRRELI